MLSAAAWSQVTQGSVVGTVKDSNGAVLPGASVDLINTETNISRTTQTNRTGDYVFEDVVPGHYTMSVEDSGFQKWVASSFTLDVRQTLRLDVKLTVGSVQQQVTVNSGALPAIETETPAISGTFSTEMALSLPTNTRASFSGTSPSNIVGTLPGMQNGYMQGPETFFQDVTVDGTSLMFSDTTNGWPSSESIDQIRADGVLVNAEYGDPGEIIATTKSGTNHIHGSAYWYYQSSDFDAIPYTYPITTSKPGQIGNTYGVSAGGPVVLPHLYNGHNKSFFFFNYEEFLETDGYGFQDTVPTANYLAGNFSQISPNGTCSACAQLGIQTTALGTPTVQLDPLGNKVYANEIFDPATRGQATSGSLAGQGYATPFPNNIIPLTRFDPISLKILSYVPAANNATQFINNYAVNQNGHRYSAIPAFKIDHNIDAKDKLSFYYSENTTQNQFNPTLGSQDGFPNTITEARGSFITNYQYRLNYDRTLSPTLLLHLGVGMFYELFRDTAPDTDFNLSNLGLTGNLINRNFPTIVGNCTTGAAGTCTNATGGMAAIGTAGAIQDPTYEPKPTATANLTWVHGKHTYKAGGEWIRENYINDPFPTITLTTGAGPTADPFTNTSSYGSFSPGFGFASFLLGDYTATSQGVPFDTHVITTDWAFFLQDSWKVTRKLTLDYGIRWDYDTPEKEEFNRWGQLDPTLANPVAGGHPGALQFATNTNGFYKSAYPYALGPRIGIAYQITPKTVFRGGWGVNYQFIQAAAGSTISSPGAYNVQANSPSYIPTADQFVNDQTPGFIQTPHYPITNAFQCPLAGATNCGTNTVTAPDSQQNRPPRINQYSAGFQRELTRNLIAEASYVGNHAVWLTPFGTSLGRLSQLSPQYLATLGLYPIPGTGPAGYNNENARALLADPLSATAVQQFLVSQGITNGGLPYAGFPTSSTLANSLVPFPQFGAIEPAGAPTGASKYDSLQAKVTKRLGHNLQAGGTFTFAKGYSLVTARQDFFNPAGDNWALQQIPPRDLNFNATYVVPKASFFPRWANQITKDWQLGWFSNYQSGAFLTPPTSVVNLNYQTSEDVRVAGQPLYTSGVNPNNQSTYNPWYTQVLNPAAWAPCPSNQNCMAAGNYIPSFRAPRTPTENANIGRNFRIKERMNLQIRGEFVNIFNRTLMPAPSTANPQAAPSKNSLGIYTSGFGIISAYYAPNTAPTPPTMATTPTLESRQGTLIARFSF